MRFVMQPSHATTAPPATKHARPTSPHDRDETPSERADRNFAELVQELRVAQTGVQILFAFLLTLAFYQSFPHDSAMFGYVLAAALLAAACSAICFMAPVAAHRMTFRLGSKEHLVWVTHRFAMVGLVLLSLAMLLAVWIVIAYLFREIPATTVVAALAVTQISLWLVLPLRFQAQAAASRPDA
jgi:hypothetical protein